MGEISSLKICSLLSTYKYARDMFRIQSNIYDEFFFAKIANG